MLAFLGSSGLFPFLFCAFLVGIVFASVLLFPKCAWRLEAAVSLYNFPFHADSLDPYRNTVIHSSFLDPPPRQRPPVFEQLLLFLTALYRPS